MNRCLFCAFTVFIPLALGCGTANPAAVSETESAATAVDSHSPVGGYNAIASDAPEVIEAAQFAVQAINARSNSLIPYQLVKVVAAKSQVVAGMNYAMTLKLRRGQVLETHDVVVFSQPWTHTMQLTKDRIR